MNYIHPPRGEITRLPKWAQEYVANLLRHVENQNAHIKEVSSEHPGSNLVLDSLRLGQPEITLPPDETIRFYLGNNRDETNAYGVIEVHHNRRTKDQIEIRSGGGPLNITPSSSNSISVGIVGR